MHRLGLALHDQRLLRLHVENAADVAIGVVGEQHPADRRGMLQAAGHVNGIAHGGELAHAADRAEQHLAGVDANSQGQGSVVGPAELIDRRLHPQRRPDGHLRVILTRRFRPPKSHDRVADVLVDAAAVVGNGLIHQQPEIIHDRGDDLGVHHFRECRKAGGVGKQNGGLLALLARLSAGAQGRQTRLNGADSGINHCIP